MNKFTIAVLMFGAIAEGKLGAPSMKKTLPKMNPVVLQSYTEPGTCCWTEEELEGRVGDKPNLCGNMWTNFIYDCEQGMTERCIEVFSGIGSKDWDSITPESAKCLNVDERCYDADSFDYRSFNEYCNEQWRTFDNWCWSDANEGNESV